MLKMNKWTAVTAVFLLLFLFGCSSGSGGENGNNGTAFPTATLHPVFSSGDEFAERLSETRAAEATQAALDEPTPTAPPTPTDEPPVSIVATPSPQPQEPGPEVTELEDAIQVPILLYHHIGVPEGGPAAAGYEYFVDPDLFDAQMAYLQDNDYNAVDLYTLYESLDGTAELPPNPVVITFDDGYIDLYENAFPILQDYGFTANFFIITDFVEEGREGYMTWENIEEMAGAGMRFETHSRSHADLRGQNTDFLISQVLDSQEVLAQHIGYTPRFIAYPFGQYDENLVRFLEEYDFWGGLTAQGGLDIALENRFTWPRLYVPAETNVDLFGELVAQGQSINYTPEIVEETTVSAPLTTTVTLSTSQGLITSTVLLLFDESLNPEWTVRTSPGVQYDLQDNENSHNGEVAFSYSPAEDFGSLFLQVRPDASTAFTRDDIIGLAFWLYTGSEPLAPDDLILVVNGSNEFPYWTAVDESVDLDVFAPSFDDNRFELGFNRPISESTWVQVILFFDDLNYNSDYQFITGLNFVNNVGVARTFLIDELVLILREP